MKKHHSYKKKRVALKNIRKARFHLFFGGKTVGRNGIRFTENERRFLLKVW